MSQSTKKMSQRRLASRDTDAADEAGGKWRRLLPLVGLLALAIALNVGSGSDGGEDGRRPNSSLAELLEREVRIHCWVLTHPKNHKTKARHIQRTWGRRCTRLLFVSTEPDDELDVLVLPVVEEYGLTWAKIKRAFQHIHAHQRDEADWFIKTDDDTYLLLENLRHLLYPYSPDTPLHFGHNFRLFGELANASYMSGGSGYVLSRAALDLFVEVALHDPSRCHIDDGAHVEDVEIGRCLHEVGVAAGDGRDAHNKHRFLPFEPHYALMSNYFEKDFWWCLYSFYQMRNSREALSELAAGFHYVSPGYMYLYDFLNYEFEAFGLRKDGPGVLPRRLAADEILIPASDNVRV